MVSVILDNLATGEAPEAIASGYHVEPDDLRAALAFAAGGTSRNPDGDLLEFKDERSDDPDPCRR